MKIKKKQTLYFSKVYISDVYIYIHIIISKYETSYNFSEKTHIEILRF